MSKILPRPKVWKDSAPSYAKDAPVVESKKAATKKGLKSKGPKMTPLRSSANGEICTLQIAGVCKGRTDTTSLCHLPFLIGTAAGMKAPDFCACYGCGDCHSVIDSRSAVMPESDRIYYGARGLVRTLERMREKGIAWFKGMDQ